MTSFNPGDVILIPFPFTDQTTTKKRPAVIVSAKKYLEERDDIILMPVTSQVAYPKYGDVVIQLWKEAGLVKTSLIKPVFATIEKNLVLKKLGKLEADDWRNLQAKIMELIELGIVQCAPTEEKSLSPEA